MTFLLLWQSQSRSGLYSYDTKTPMAAGEALHFMGTCFFSHFSPKAITHRHVV